MTAYCSTFLLFLSASELELRLWLPIFLGQAQLTRSIFLPERARDQARFSPECAPYRAISPPKFALCPGSSCLWCDLLPSNYLLDCAASPSIF